MIWTYYGDKFAKDMVCGIQLVRDHHAALESAGETVWSVTKKLTDMLDDLSRTT